MGYLYLFYVLVISGGGAGSCRAEGKCPAFAWWGKVVPRRVGVLRFTPNDTARRRRRLVVYLLLSDHITRRLRTWVSAGGTG